MKRRKPKTFSSAREVFKTYLPKNTQAEMSNSYGQVEDRRASELLEDFRSSLEKHARRRTS